MKYNNIYVDGRHYKRVNKTKARNLYNQGVEITMYPINANPSSDWIQGHNICINDLYTIDFDTRINSYIYYNCIAELGAYLKYYIVIQDNRMGGY